MFDSRQNACPALSSTISSDVKKMEDEYRRLKQLVADQDLVIVAEWGSPWWRPAMNSSTYRSVGEPRKPRIYR